MLEKPELKVWKEVNYIFSARKIKVFKLFLVFFTFNGFSLKILLSEEMNTHSFLIFWKTDQGGHEETPFWLEKLMFPILQNLEF